MELGVLWRFASAVEGSAAGAAKTLAMAVRATKTEVNETIVECWYNCGLILLIGAAVRSYTNGGAKGSYLYLQFSQISSRVEV